MSTAIAAQARRYAAWPTPDFFSTGKVDVWSATGGHDIVSEVMPWGRLSWYPTMRTIVVATFRPAGDGQMERLLVEPQLREPVQVAPLRVWVMWCEHEVCGCRGIIGEAVS